MIRGVGGTTAVATLAACGGNAIRTWDAAAAEAVLDEADAAGITVTVGLWLGHERHGFDYGDVGQLEQQRQEVAAAVTRLKDHPAVLAWGLGNEMEGPGGPGDSPAIWKEVDHLARLIKRLDPHHPVMTVVANVSPEQTGGNRRACAARRHPRRRTPTPRATAIGANLREAGWERPYCITEYGLPGPWEAPHTDWNAPIEPTSREKAALTYAGCKRIMADETHCLGSYAFLWGSKQEATASWFGMLLPSGEKTPRADALARAWTGQLAGRSGADPGAGRDAAGGPAGATGRDLRRDVAYRDPEGPGPPLPLGGAARRAATDARGAMPSSPRR